MPGWVTVANEAIAIAGRDPELTAAVLWLYARADSLDWRPFQAGDTWLELEMGLPKRKARLLIAGLTAVGCLSVVHPGDRNTARTIQIAQPKRREEVIHGADRTANHSANNVGAGKTPSSGRRDPQREPPREPQPELIHPTSTSTSTRSPPSPQGGKTVTADVLRAVFDRWIPLYRMVEPGARKTAWADKERVKITARLNEQDTTIEDVYAMLAWARLSKEDYAKHLRGEPCAINKFQPTRHYAGPDTLFKTEKWGLRVEAGRRFMREIGGFEALEAIEHAERLLQAEQSDGSETGGDGARSGAHATEPSRDAEGEGGRRRDDEGVDGAAGRESPDRGGTPVGHLRLVEGKS